MEMAEMEKKEPYLVSLIPENQIRSVEELLHADYLSMEEIVRLEMMGKFDERISVSKKSGSSINKPPSVDPPKTQRELSLTDEEDLAPGLIEVLWPDRMKMKRPPSVSKKSGSSMNKPPSVHPPKTQRVLNVAPAASKKKKSPPSAPLCMLPPSVSVKSDSPDSHLQKTQSEPLSETDSTALNVSMMSDSSMFDPPYFKLKRKQSQLTEEISSCSVCEEAVKDPVRLLCGHWSCKQCVLSFRNQSGSTADYSCKKCGMRSETDQDLQSVLLEKKIKRVEMEMDKLQAEKEKLQAEKEKFQAEKEKFQAEKEKSQPEKETFQAEKEKLQAEKEKIELEKRKLTLEIKLLEQRGSYTNYDHGVVIPKTRIPYI